METAKSPNGKRFPQVLLVGNGLNRAFQGDSWKNAVLKMWKNQRLKTETEKEAAKEALPYPFLIVLGTNDNVDTVLKEEEENEEKAENKEKKIKKINEYFPTIKDTPELTAMYGKLLTAGFDHILTTNYTYELERTAYPNVISIENYAARNLQSVSVPNKAPERKYLLHTYYNVEYEGHKNKIWHIHGEVRKPDSIILGHDYYGRLLNKYQSEFAERKDKQFMHQKEGKDPIMNSWLDAFIMGDVHVLGFGYDLSEFDLWWLLSRKKRENAECGKVYFYEPSFGKEMKHELMRAYGVKVSDLGFDSEKVDYKAFYEKAIEHICNKIKD